MVFLQENFIYGVIYIHTHKDVKKMKCKKDGTEKCKTPELNTPDGMCIMWNCPQARKTLKQDLKDGRN